MKDNEVLIIHELAHLFLTPASSQPEDNKVEEEANRFAADLVVHDIPDSF